MTEGLALVPYCASAPCGNGWTAANDGTGTWLCNKCRRVSKAVYFNMLSKTIQRESKNMARKAANTNNNIDINALVAEIIAVLQKHAGETPVVAEPPAKSKAKPAAEVDEETGVEEGTERRAELEGMTIAALRKEAIAAGFDKDDVKGASKEEIIESLLDDEDEVEQEDEDEEVEEADDADEDDSDEDSDEDEDDEDGEGYTAADLEDLGLTALKKIAKDEFEETTASLKGLDREDVMAIILGEDADEDGDDEDEDDDNDDDSEYTEEDLEGMSLAEIRALCKEYGVKVKPGMKKAALIEAFFEDDDE